MFTYLIQKKENFIFLYGARALVFILSFSLIFAPSTGYAQSVFVANLPVPGTMVPPSPAFVPVLLKGMTIHPDDPLKFDFIIDSGNTDFDETRIKDESQRLVKYFLASMTIPKDDLWVNLSPYESDKIIPEELGKTELGRDMLAQDYILKQLTASLMYPEKELGKEFWNKVYQKAQEKYGTTEIPVDTFNKVWILPETATVYEHGQTVYIVDARLKVMLEHDYQALQQSRAETPAPLFHEVKQQGLDSDYEAMQYETKDQRLKTKDFRSDESSVISLQSSVSSEIIKEIILPEIEREVNEGQNFAPLRQIYHSLILAKWYKETIKNSLLSKVYVDKKLINGIRLEDGQLKREDGSIIDSQSSIVDRIYDQYMEAYKKGVFNYIKEDYDRLSNEVIPRKYFSGGEELTKIVLERSSSPVRNNGFLGKGLKILVALTVAGTLSQAYPVFAQSSQTVSQAQQQKTANLVHDSQLQVDETLKTEIDFLRLWGKLHNSPYLSAEDRFETLRSINFLIAGNQISLSQNAIVELAEELQSIIRRPNYDPKEGGNRFYGSHYYAVYTLGLLGPGAKSAIPLLQEIYPSYNYNYDQVTRSAAVDALASIAGKKGGTLKTTEEFPTAKDQAEVKYKLNLTQKDLDYYLLSSVINSDRISEEAFLSWGANPNARYTTYKNESSHTALILAVQFGDVRSVKLLIKYGADVNGYGWQPVDHDYEVMNPLTEIPSGDESSEISKLLLSHGARWPSRTEKLLVYNATSFVPKAVAAGAGLGLALVSFAAWRKYTARGNYLRLKSGNLETRRDAIKRSVQFNDGRAIEPLFKGLGDWNSDIRKMTREALRVLGASRDQMVLAYIKALKSNDSDVLMDAADGLKEFGDSSAIEPLFKLLENQYSGVRKKVREALTALGANRDQMVLGYIAALESNDSGAKLDAIDGLKRLSDARGIEPLLKLLGHGNRDVHQKTREALTVLGAGRDQMVAGYIAALESDSYEVRRYAVEALKGFSDSRAIEPLLKHLGDSDSGVRKKTDEALMVLGATRDQMVLGYLAALKSNDSGVQMNAVGALKGLGDPHAIGPLEALLLSKPKTIEVDYGHEEYSGPYGESSGWVSDWRTENNPEYFAIENALQKLRGKAGGAVSSPLESGALNRDLVKKMIMDKKISLTDIKDERLKKFLQSLKQNNLTDVVVMGGAIKSVLFNEDVSDIDISVKMAFTEEERTLFAPLTAAGNERVYQRAAESIGQLAEMLGVKAADFLPPSRGARKAFEGLDIDYFGPIKTERGVVIKRSIFDAATKQGYFTNTAAGLLRFGIDAEGNIYGDVGVLRELLQGNLTIEGDGSNFGINSILRVLRLKYQYGLRISDQDYQLMRNDLTRRRKHPLPPVVLEVARDQVKKLLTNTQDSEAAQQELETLGISALVSQSSSPITGEKLNQVKEILSMFGINEIENANELDGGVGSQDKPIHVFSPQGEMVLRRSRYKEPQLKFIVSVMNRLKSEGIPVPTLYSREGGDALQSGSYIADYQGSRYTLEEYLTTGKNIPLEDVSRDQFIEIAQLAAKINNALSGFQPQGNKRFKSRTEIAGDLQNSFAEYKKTVESLPVDKRQEGHILFRRYSDFFMNQLEIFRQEYDADAQKTSITHSDLHPGNIKFDGMGKIAGLIDFDFTITDHRVIEFNNLIMGKDDVAQDLPYSRDKMLAMVSAYNRAVSDKLSDAEIKAIIEVIRLRFLEEIHSRFVKENSHIPANIFEHPDQLPFAYTSISLFEQFAEDFSTDEKIQTFVDEVNESGTIPDLHVQSSSPAITTREERSVAAKDELGGIDMNAIDLEREGGGVDIQFDPVELQELIDAGIDGFAPVIINITPLPSVLPLLGLEPRKEEDAEELSLLN